MGKIKLAALEKFVILIHFRNPFLNNGGSENIIQQHYQELTKRGYSCIILFPVVKKIFSRKIRGWGFLYGREFAGVYSIEKVLSTLNVINGKNGCEGIFVHSLLSAAVDEIKRILSLRRRVCVYIHDYSMCCTRYTLMKNGQCYCGDATITDRKCHDCDYYGSTIYLRRDVRYLLDDIEDLVLIAPSVSVYQLWGDSYPEYKDKICVIPHYQLTGEYLDNMDPIQDNEPLKVAFVGKSMREKGIDLWLSSTSCIHSERNANIEFYHFGNMDYQSDCVQHVPVDILVDGRDGMLRKLREYKIHACALISAVPETYSLTYFECLSANCFVITTSDSGNIPIEVEKRGNGIVIPHTEDALTDLLADEGRLRQMINKFRSWNKYGPLASEINCQFLDFLNHESGEPAQTGFSLKRAIQAVCADLYYKRHYTAELKRMA